MVVQFSVSHCYYGYWYYWLYSFRYSIRLLGAPFWTGEEVVRPRERRNLGGRESTTSSSPWHHAQLLSHLFLVGSLALVSVEVDRSDQCSYDWQWWAPFGGCLRCDQGWYYRKHGNYALADITGIVQNNNSDSCKCTMHTTNQPMQRLILARHYKLVAQ